MKFALRIKNMRFAHFMFSQKTFHGASHFICLQGKFHCAPRRAILLTNCKNNFSYVLAALEDRVSLGGIFNGEHFIYRGFN